MKRTVTAIVLVLVLIVTSCGENYEIVSSSIEPTKEFDITNIDEYLTYMDMLTSLYGYEENDVLLYNKNIKFTSEVTKDYQVSEILGCCFDIDFTLYGDTGAEYAYKDGSCSYYDTSGCVGAVNMADYYFLSYQSTRVVGLKGSNRKYVSVDETRKHFLEFPDFIEEDEENFSLSKTYYDFSSAEELNANYFRRNELMVLMNSYIYVYALNAGQDFFITDEYDRSMIKDFAAEKENNIINFSYKIESLNDKSYGDDPSNIKDIYSTVEGAIDTDTKLLNISIDYTVKNNGLLWKQVTLNNKIEVNNEEITFVPETDYIESIDALTY